MRIGMGALEDATISRDLCQAIKCGAYPDYTTVPGGIATVQACSQQFGAGVLSFCDPACRSSWPLIDRNNPEFSPIASRCNPPKANAPTPAPTAVLTPANIVQPLPQLTRVFEATPAPQQKCSVWCDMNAAIAANPFTSLAILGGLALMMWPRRSR